MLQDLGVLSIELMTNNPEKVSSLQHLGIIVEKRIPTLVAATPFSAEYLEVKRRRMQHELPSGVFHQKPTNDSGDDGGDSSDPAATH